MNELLLVITLLLTYGGVLLAFRYFGNVGLYCFTVFATLTANIEVLLVVDAFGMEMTLGNILFASTFLITDILSETSGKADANRAVTIGIVTAAAFMVFSQLWLLYIPSSQDWAREAFVTIFSNTPRLLLASLLVYAVSQKFDVWAYHKWWALTTKWCGDSGKMLWLRNNGSTLISQLINTILYTFGAFLFLYDWNTLLHICISTYVIYIVTSLLDTPYVYLARAIAQKNRIQK